MFAGLLTVGPTLALWGNAEQMLAALSPFNVTAPRNYWASDKILLLQVNTRLNAETAEIYAHQASGVAVVFWGRLDNRSDLIVALKAEPNCSDEALIALAWLQWGEQCPEKLIGDFAFAIASPQNGTVFLARDVMGVKPLFYRIDENGIFFANSVAAFKSVRIGNLTPCRRWMASFLIDTSYSHTETAYVEIKKLPGAHCLLIHADGQTNQRRFHQFIDNAPVERKRDIRWLDQYKAVWQQSIANRLPKNGSIVCENSGGLDSGSITAEVAKQLGGDIERLHGMGFCHEQNEPGYIMATAMKWGINSNTLFSANSHPRWMSIIERTIRVSGYPQEHLNGASHYPIYELCQRQGHAVLFSGFGGDEAVTNPGGFPARLELFDQKNWLQLWRSFEGPLPMQAARLAKTFVYATRKTPTHDRGMLATWKARWPLQFLRREVLDEYGLENDYFASATYDEKYRKINDAVLYLISRPYAPVRLENCTLMAASYGVDYVWPLWDQRLLQQWLSTPAIWKVGDKGITRYLHRKAVSDVCAEQVTWKPTKDMGLAGTKDTAENHDNTVMLKRLLSLLEDLPVELVDLLDIERLSSEVRLALNEKRRGAEYSLVMSRNIEKLENLVLWLKLDKENMKV